MHFVIKPRKEENLQIEVLLILLEHQEYYPKFRDIDDRGGMISRGYKCKFILKT